MPQDFSIIIVFLYVIQFGWMNVVSEGAGKKPFILWSKVLYNWKSRDFSERELCY